MALDGSNALLLLGGFVWFFIPLATAALTRRGADLDLHSSDFILEDCCTIPCAELTAPNDEASFWWRFGWGAAAHVIPACSICWDT